MGVVGRRIAVAAVVLLLVGCTSMVSSGVRSLDETPPVFDDGVPGLIERANTEACNFLNGESPARYSFIEVSFVPFRDHNREGRSVGILTNSFLYAVSLPAENGQNAVDAAILVPQQFATDFFSTPGWAAFFVGKAPRYREAAVVHDWLYAVGRNGDEEQRLFADRVLRHAMIQLEADPETVNRVFWAVRGRTAARVFGRDGELRFYDRTSSTWVSVLPATQAERDRLFATTVCTREERPTIASTASQ
jgi:hypothetical protein